jgi:hypothetical protein
MSSVIRRSAFCNPKKTKRVTWVAAAAIPALRAQLTGNDLCSAPGVTVQSASPVLGLCRKLIEAGHDPATPLHAYRGSMLALKVLSIGEGAKLSVEDNHLGRPTFRRWRDRPGSDGASAPVRETEPPAGSHLADPNTCASDAAAPAHALPLAVITEKGQ